MWDIILDTAIDALKMLPFLFGAYLLIELIEHKASGKIRKILEKSGKFGAFWGAILGLFPQCGFSVAAANLYAGGIITTGTVVAVFISTSDEALPIFLAHPQSYGLMLQLMAVKLVVAIFAGFLADFVLRRSMEKSPVIHHADHQHVHCGHCDCRGGVWRNALKHTGSTFLFIVLCMLVLNFVIAWIGEENLSRVLMSNSIFQPAIAALIGFIPNCAASVILTELFLSGTISFGAVVAGLCTGVGVGMIVLMRTNHKMKENLKIIAYLFVIGTLTGIILQLFYRI